MTLRRPPRLRPGARVALIAPAGPVDEERVARAIENCERLELEPVLGSAVRRKVDYLAGSDTERAADLRDALTDPAIDAVWALRGGYGTMRTLAALGPIPPHPSRAYIGFSDNTAVHLALLRRGVVSFHGPHAGGSLPEFAEDVLRRVLFDAHAAGTLPNDPEQEAPVTISGGIAEGDLIGGNLSLLAALIGTPWQPELGGRILFVEEVSESFYRIDRMFMQLRLAGILDGVKGIVLGQFTDCCSDEPGRAIEQLFVELLGPLRVPVASGFPFGHVPGNWTLPLGVRARLDADAGTLTLLEPAVTEEAQ